jgi:HK97 family phage major capsid protein
VTAVENRNYGASKKVSDIAKLNFLRGALLAEMRLTLDTASNENRELRPAEAAEYDAKEKRVAALEARLETAHRERRGGKPAPDLLGGGAADLDASRGDGIPGRTDEKRLGAIVGQEARALGEASGSGSYVVPEVYSSTFFDALTAQSVALKSGVTVLNMSSDVLHVPVGTADPSAAWVAEAGAITPSDPTYVERVLVAMKLAAIVTASNESLSDSNPQLQGLVAKQLVRSLSLTLDLAVYEGLGHGSNQPPGLRGTSGIGTVSMGANGAALVDLDPIADAVNQISAANATASAIVMPARTCGYAWQGHGEEPISELPEWVIEKWRGERKRRYREHGPAPLINDLAELVDRITIITGAEPRFRGKFGSYRCQRPRRPQSLRVAAHRGAHHRRVLRRLHPRADPQSARGDDVSAAGIFGGHSIEVQRMSTVKRRRVRWLPGYEGLIPLGMLTLLAGQQGFGKSLYGHMLAADVSRSGRAVLLASAEEPARELIRPRLEAAGADLDLVMRMTIEQDAGIKLPDHVGALREVVLEHDPGLVIVDPIGAYVGGNIDTWKDDSVRLVMTPLAELAEDAGCAFLLVAHLNKGTGDYLNRVMGSTAWTASVRSALLFSDNPDEPDSDERLLSLGKTNLSPRGTLSRVYRITEVELPADEDNERVDAPRLELVGTSTATPARVLNGHAPSEVTQAACEFLSVMLKDGPAASAALIDQAEDEGISEPTLRRAAKRLGVVIQRGGFPARGQWSLPPVDLMKGLDVS